VATSAIRGSAPANPTPQSLATIRADVTRYVNKIGNDGWLKTRDGLANPAAFVYLCKYTKVTLLGSNGGRTFFRVGDGTYRGRVLNMAEANATEYFGKLAPTAGVLTVSVTYGRYVPHWVSVARGGQQIPQQMATVVAGSLTLQATMNSVWGRAFYPIPAGSYDIHLPDVPHGADMTRFYRNTEPSLVHDQVWFPIGFGDGSRYVHVGNVSDGCTTILDLGHWAALHEKLISHRSADGKSVGRLVVAGVPERAR
jgi:hypothetical protein